MKVIVTEDTNVLLPNTEYKNFTESTEVIKAGTELEGEPKEVAGLRRGKPFVYRLFSTKEGKILFINKIKPMNMTEVKLGADSSVSATDINLIPAEMSKKYKFYGVIAGGALGFAAFKYRKQEGAKKMATYIGLGALAGYLAGSMLYKNKIKVKQSK